MFAGDKRYFCADISSDVVIGATMHGKLWPVPLLTQEKVDQAMREDKEAALREYKKYFYFRRRRRAGNKKSYYY